MRRTNIVQGILVLEVAAAAAQFAGITTGSRDTTPPSVPDGLGAAVADDVAITACSGAYLEPMDKGITAAQTAAFDLAQYFSVKFTSDADQACMKRAITSHATYWKHTRSSLAFNPFQVMIYKGDGTSAATGDIERTYDVMNWCRSQLDSRCVLGRNSIQPERFEGGHQKLYDRMREMGGPIYFQTVNSNKLAADEVWPTIDDFATQRERASYVELNMTYGTYDRAHLRRVDDAEEAIAASIR